MGKYVRLCLVLFAIAIGLVLLLISALPSFSARASESPPAQTAVEVTTAARPQGVDLDVTFINRSPLYKAYCVDYPWDVPGQPGIPYLCPGTENDKRWPDHGEVVTFTAHIVNKGTVASPAFEYVWTIDQHEVASGVLPALAVGAEVTATYQWAWAHTMSADGQRAMDDHTVGFRVDPANVIVETYETNNALEDRTNAMSFSMYLTPEAFEAYNTPVDPKYPYSAEDWLQKQVAAMNAAFANSTYPVAPQGATVRVRVNTIAVTSTNPGPDGEHDGGWFLADDVRCPDCGYYDSSVDVDWGLVHELSHQVSLIDLYAIGVYAPNVFVTDKNGLPANVGFGWRSGGLMFGGDISPHTDTHLYESHSAAGASTFAGYRNGYYGSYLYDIPLYNYLRILDNQGNPAYGVQVALYQRTGPFDGIGHMGVDNTPEMTGTTDSHGLFLLHNRSANGGTVTRNGHVLHDNPFGVVDIVGNQGLFLIRLVRQDHEEFHWLDITQFNLAYWSGDTISHIFTINSRVPPTGAPSAPEWHSVRVEGNRASLEWRPSQSQGVVGYRVYRATPPQHEYFAASGLLTDTEFQEEFSGAYDDGQHRLYAVTAVGSDGRESGFGQFAYAPGVADPVAVAIAPDGARVVLNNWNLYPLLSLRPDGRYTRRLVNPHYDMVSATGLAFDPVGNLLVSGFGGCLSGRCAVRIYSPDMQPIGGFGSEGSAPGQFVAPSAIALSGPACTYGGPYDADEHTELLLHLDGSYAGTQGEQATASGTEFAAGRYGQGVFVDATDTLTYTSTGLDPAQGAIEFWLRPNWDGDDNQNHTFFQVGAEWAKGLKITKDAANNLRLMVWDGEAEYGVAHGVGEWQAGEWHHVAVTWRGTNIALYVDGGQVEVDHKVHLPDTLVGDLYVGSSSWPNQQAETTLDEFRVSNVARVGNSDICSRILVADSANCRIQAFDHLGNLLAAFGNPGDGQGQFSSPQGVAVDGSGRVIVVDQGNNRVVLLSFDGETFGYLGTMTAGFKGPTGVAVDAWDRIYVADTGNNRVVVLNGTGNLVAEYTAPNDGYLGGFSGPRGVAVDAWGDVVVADTGNHRVVTIREGAPGHKLWLPLVLRR